MFLPLFLRFDWVWEGTHFHCGINRPSPEQRFPACSSSCCICIAWVLRGPCVKPRERFAPLVAKLARINHGVVLHRFQTGGRCLSWISFLVDRVFFKDPFQSPKRFTMFYLSLRYLMLQSCKLLWYRHYCLMRSCTQWLLQVVNRLGVREINPQFCWMLQSESIPKMGKPCILNWEPVPKTWVNLAVHYQKHVSEFRWALHFDFKKCFHTWVNPAV